jgi:adenosylmethionine---8-amino-7-oxononanoate aminotransferase
MRAPNLRLPKTPAPRSSVDRAEIVRLDKRHVWHPYTAMDAYASIDPIVVARAEGPFLWDEDGSRLIDGNSSWWTSALGHRHPRIVAAIQRQLQSLDHCALAGIAHEQSSRLAEELVAVAPRGLSRVFYTDNGSTAIEAAVKMAVQFWTQAGKPKKTRFVALDGAFHGDSIGAASLGGVEIFRRPFANVLFDCVHVPFPSDYDKAFAALSELIMVEHDTIAAVVVESIVQGASGMRMYDARFLKELSDVARANDVLLIVDEVFAGYGRTGPMWACDHANVTPDLMCIGKAFAGGVLPMAAVLATERVFDGFRGDASRAFYYGHTFCGNPLGAAIAREVLAVYREEAILDQVARKQPLIRQAFDRIALIPGVARVRSLGMIGAADLGDGGYTSDLGWRVYAHARKAGAYLRPLGDTVYVCPPLTIGQDVLGELLNILEDSVRAVMTAR